MKTTRATLTFDFAHPEADDPAKRVADICDRISARIRLKRPDFIAGFCEGAADFDGMGAVAWKIEDAAAKPSSLILPEQAADAAEERAVKRAENGYRTIAEGGNG